MTLYDADQENINVKGRQGDNELRLNDMTNTKSDKGKVTLKHGLIFFSFHGKKAIEKHFLEMAACSVYMCSQVNFIYIPKVANLPQRALQSIQRKHDEDFQ